MTPKTKRPRRVGSDEAHAWARNLRLHNPLGKLVLSMTTIYVNGEGACFVGVAQLAEDCELAQNTIRSRLAWLEQIGAIARFPQWVDEHGRRNSDGRGKRTSDEIRLLLEADAEAIEARALGDNVEISPSPGEGLNAEQQGESEGEAGQDHDSKNEVGTPVALQQPSNCVQGLNPLNPNPNLSTPTPPSHDAPPQDSREGTEPEGWQEFEKEFTADGIPILRVSLAQPLFASLKPEERALAIRAAAGLIASRKRQKKPGAKPAAQTFLRERDAWPGFASAAPPPPPPKLFVAEGTRQFRALRMLGAICGRPIPRLAEHEGQRGIWHFGEMPADLIALGDLEAKPFDEWHVVETGTQPFGAWFERIHRWDSRAPEPMLFPTGGEVEFVVNGETIRGPKKIRGLRVPSPWPPRKDGSWPEADAAA